MSGYTFGVPHVMNSADSRTRAPKPLVVVAAAVVLAGIGGAGLYVALGRAPEPSGAAPVEPRPAAPPAPAPAVPPPRPGRVLSVAYAVKQLHLLPPTPPHPPPAFPLPPP